MRGRFQALLVTVLGAGSMMFCWVSAAVVALVTLRKGAGQGAWLLLWALLPAGTMLYLYAESGPLALLIGTMALALVLRATVNMPLAVLASVAVGAVTGLGLYAFNGQYLEQIIAAFGEFLANLEQQLSQGGEPVVLARPEAVQIAGMLGTGTAMMAVLSLLLGRYWQAALYNPGGFGAEFKALRYPVAVSASLALGMVALASLGLQYRSWAMMCAVPLSFAGIALVHARAEARGRGKGWLIGFYLAWLLFDPVKLLVVFVAIADSWFDFRQRWAASAGSDVDEHNEDKDKDKDKD